MEHNPITSGDLAMSRVEDERYRRRKLELRLAELEARYEQIVAWSETIAEELNAMAEFIGYGEK